MVYIYANIWGILMVNVTMIIAYMDPSWVRFPGVSQVSSASNPVPAVRTAFLRGKTPTPSVKTWSSRWRRKGSTQQI